MRKFLAILIVLATFLLHVSGAMDGFSCITKRFSKDCVHSTDLYSSPQSAILLGMYGSKFERLFRHDTNKDSCMDRKEWSSMPEKMRHDVASALC